MPIDMKRENKYSPAKSVQTPENRKEDETRAAQRVSFNKNKNQWQTPDGRLFVTRLKAERHLNNN